jgi:A/G-specific adenine glycosylase
MLQQTQVSRVEVKYKSFLKKFPTVHALADAKLADVLTEWQGLGYNRRAIFLKRAAEKVVADFDGKFPRDFKTLCSLPGIGPATAGDLMAFAWNEPVVVIETNIRSVFIHFFFKEKQGSKDVRKIHDKEILPLIEKTLDRENPREWYYALFDYGAHLKREFRRGEKRGKDGNGGNPSRRSAHYTKQSKFEGSYRQKRAAAVRIILRKPSSRVEILEQLQKNLDCDMDILEILLDDLIKNGFVSKARDDLFVIV